MPGPYRVGLRGERNYQAAILRSDVGERVALVHDSENVHDGRAVAIATLRKEIIGYLPKDGWLTEVFLDQEESIRATIDTIARGGNGDLDVVLSVEW